MKANKPFRGVNRWPGLPGCRKIAFEPGEILYKAADIQARQALARGAENGVSCDYVLKLGSELSSGYLAAISGPEPATNEPLLVAVNRR